MEEQGLTAVILSFCDTHLGGKCKYLNTLILNYNFLNKSDFRVRGKNVHLIMNKNKKGDKN